MPGGQCVLGQECGDPADFPGSFQLTSPDQVTHWGHFQPVCQLHFASPAQPHGYEDKTVAAVEAPDHPEGGAENLQQLQMCLPFGSGDPMEGTPTQEPCRCLSPRAPRCHHVLVEFPFSGACARELLGGGGELC